MSLQTPVYPEILKNVIVGFFTATERGPCEFAISPWQLPQTPITAWTFGDSGASLIGNAETLKSCVGGARRLVYELAEGSPPVVIHSPHSKSMLQRLLNFYRVSVGDDGFSSRDGNVIYRDPVDDINAPAILTYEERIAFGPDRIAAILGRRTPTTPQEVLEALWQTIPPLTPQ